MMSSEDRNAKVVITADTKQYNQNIKAASAETAKLEKSIAGLTSKLDGLLKRTGKKMMLIGAADLAALTAASTVAATLEKQMSDMEAAAVNMKGALDMGSVKDNIRSLSREFPVARGEIVQLETAITKMGLSATNQVNSMTRAFIQLGGATGESSIGLAQGQIGLSRQMGTLTQNPRTMNRQNDATTVLASQGGVSATDMLSFSQSIAPVAAMSGMSENQVKGVSTAFLRAGANGTYAANVFSQITNDLVRMQQTNSPDIQKYANILGVSQKEISGMNPVDVLDRMTKQTAAGGNMRTLDYLGIDSIRAQKALQGLAGEGGVQKWIDVANEASANDKNETAEAAEVAFTGFFDSMEQLRNRFTDFTQAIGEPILKPLTWLANGLNALMGAVQPLTNVISSIAGIGGGLGGVGLLAGGAALKSWAGISTPVIGKRVLSSTFGESLRFGLSHGSMRAAGLTPNDAVASRMVPGTPGGFGWFNRGVYGAMGHVGGMFPGVYDPSGKRVGFGNPFRTAINMGLMGAGNLATGSMGMGGLTEHYKKGSLASGHERIGYEGRGRGFFSSFGASLKNGPMHEIIGDRPGKPLVTPSTNIADAKASAGPLEQLRIKMAEIMASLKTAVDTAVSSLMRFAKSLNSTVGSKVSNLASNANAKTTKEFADSLKNGTAIAVVDNKTMTEHVGVVSAESKVRKTSTREIASSTPVMKMLRKQMTDTGMSFYQLAAAATRTARSLAGTAAGGAVRGAGAAAGGLMSMMGMHPGLMAGLAAAYVGVTAYSGNQDLEKKLSDIAATASDSSNGLRVYNEALGLSTEALIGFTGALKQAPGNAKQALDPNALRQIAIESPEYTNSGVSEMTADQARGWISGLGAMTPDQMQAVGADIVRKFGMTPDSRSLLDTLQNQKSGQSQYNAAGYSSSFDQVGKLNQATDFEGVGAWDNLFRANAGVTNQGYLEKLLADGSPIRSITDTAFQQAAGNINYVSSNLTTGKGDKADERMNMATALNEYTSVVASSLEGVSNNAGSKSDLENASAVASATKALQLLGMNPDEINQKVEDLGIKGMDFAGQSEQQRKDWVWQNVIAPNIPEAGQFGGMEGVESEAGGPATSRRQYTAQAEQTMNSLTKVSKDFKEFTEKWGDNGLFAKAAMNEDPKTGAKSIEMLKKIAENTSGSFGEGEAKLRTLGAYDATMQPYTDAAIAEMRAKRTRELSGANQAVQGGVMLDDLQGAISGFTNKNESIAALKESKSAAEEWIAGWYAKLKEYNKMMAREEIDYNINRARSNEDYNRQIAYSQEDFYRGQRYQKQDFHRSMLRQEEDYQVQLTRMVEDASRTMYDPFSRVMSQGARSGGSHLFNLKEQNELIKAQREGIDKLKEMGLSQAAIDDLGLMDPGKAQQVAYWADGGIDKKEIAGTNKAIGRRRDLTEDMVLSDDNQGFRRQEEDRTKMIDRTVKDFHRGMRRSTEEFMRQMERGEKDYRRSLNRMDADRERNLERAKKDMLGFLKDSQKTVEEQAAYVNKILGKMHNRVADAMINIVDKMIVAIQKAEALTAGSGKKSKKGAIPSALDDIITLDELGGTGTAQAPALKKDRKYTGGTNRDPGGYYDRDDVYHIMPHPYNYGGSTNRSSARRHADGGIALQQQWGVIGEAGPEAIIPLNSRGAKFMADALAMMHTKGKNMSYGEASSAMNVYNNSTNFNGAIHIEAQDPNEMTRKLKHKARMNALRGGQTMIYKF